MLCRWCAVHSAVQTWWYNRTNLAVHCLAGRQRHGADRAPVVPALRYSGGRGGGWYNEAEGPGAQQKPLCMHCRMLRVCASPPIDKLSSYVVNLDRDDVHAPPPRTSNQPKALAKAGNLLLPPQVTHIKGDDIGPPGKRAGDLDCIVNRLGAAAQERRQWRRGCTT